MTEKDKISVAFVCLGNMYVFFTSPAYEIHF